MQTFETEGLFEEYFKYTAHRTHNKRTWLHGITLETPRFRPIVDTALSNGGSVLLVEPSRLTYEYAMMNFSGASFRNASLQSAMFAVDAGTEEPPDNLLLFAPDGQRHLVLGQMEFFRVRRTWVVAEFDGGFKASDFDPQIWCTAQTPAGEDGPLLVWSLKLKGM